MSRLIAIVGRPNVGKSTILSVVTAAKPKIANYGVDGLKSDELLATWEQAWDMLNYIADQGVTYFAFNTKIQACEHNHAFFGKKCPICGGEVFTEYTRIVGFYTSTKSWSKARRDEYKLREWADVNQGNN